MVTELRVLDIGKGCRLVPFYWCLHNPVHHSWDGPCSCGLNDECPAPEHVGWYFVHPQPERQSGECWGSIYIRQVFQKPHAVWAVAQTDPLTLKPSILCALHPNWHAFVQDGKWTG